jgi:hypothetical protein
MSYDTKQDTITVNDVVYHVEREPDRGSPEETLTIKEFSVEQDDWVFPFEGLKATLGMEEYIETFMSPRDWTNVGTMAVSYSGYNLGDEDISKMDFEIECPICEGTGESDNWVVGITESCTRMAVGSEEECQQYIDALPNVESGMYFIEPIACSRCDGEACLTLDPVTYFKSEENARVVLPLIVYEHSGITMSVGSVGDYPFDSAGWDTSFVGFIYDTPEGVKQCMGDNVADEDIIKALRQEVEVYASYLEGDVTFYRVEDEETGYDEGCGGYVGDAKHCEEECFASLEGAIEARLAENKERADMAARDIMTKE